MTPREFFDRALCEDSKFTLAKMIKEVEEECKGDLLQYFIEDLKRIADRWRESERVKTHNEDEGVYWSEVDTLNLHYLSYGIPNETYDEMLNNIHKPLPLEFYPLPPLPDSFQWALGKLEEFVITDSVIDTSTHGLNTSTGSSHKGLRLPSVLNTPDCWEIWEQAKEEGLISDDFKWQKGLQLLACFAREMSIRFSLGTGINSNGTKRIKWRIFEELFFIEKGKLRSNYNDIQKTGAEPSEINIINKIFGL